MDNLKSVHMIIPPRCQSTGLLHQDTATSPWSQGHQQCVPLTKGMRHARVEAISVAILGQASESGARFPAVPNSSLGLTMESLSSSWSLPCWQPTFLPSLRCNNHHYQYAALNDIIHWALTTAQILSRLEPTTLKENILMASMVIWKSENLYFFVSDATCVDTYTPSHLAHPLLLVR